ncbi:acid protease [Durotheca rogersii]|uniref:acid protease n=1 Tax=Durotheca rogersii TaxID=419775 RepID=UPI002220A427|nr:acid protease [Durotheca rogersii]KAI5862362.1 acid protease [Durotheca rogersii]
MHLHQASVSLPLLLWASGISALSPHPPGNQASSGHAGLGERDSTNVPVYETPDIGFVTFPLVRKAQSYKKSLADRLPRAFDSLSTKSGPGASIRPAPEDLSLRNRANEYNVVPANKPTVRNAVGIDQDGTDFSYFLQAGFGSDDKPMYMLVDTGASTTWVMGSGCTSDPCTRHNTFGPNDSRTYRDTGEPYNVEYGSGKVSGHVVIDSISIADLQVTMPFGVANITSNQFSQFPFEGILGLSMTQGTWLTHVKEAQLISSNVFGIALSRSSDGANDGEIAFGAPNTAKYTGDITYTSLRSTDSWAIPMDDVLYGGEPAGVRGRVAFIDTGTTFVFGPPADVRALYSLIPGSSTTDNGQTYTVPCDSNVPVSFSFSGQRWDALAKDFTTKKNADGICFGNIYGLEFVPGAWLIGDMFLKNVYSVFDMDQRRIGFAARATSSSNNNGSSQGTPTPSNGSNGGASTTVELTSPTGGSVGLVPPSETSTPTDAAGNNESTPDPVDSPGSAGVRLGSGVLYASLLCIVSAITMIL